MTWILRNIDEHLYCYHDCGYLNNIIVILYLGEQSQIFMLLLESRTTKFAIMIFFVTW